MIGFIIVNSILLLELSILSLLCIIIYLRGTLEAKEFRLNFQFYVTITKFYYKAEGSSLLCFHLETKKL